jgi:hypothetical protein
VSLIVGEQLDVAQPPAVLEQVLARPIPLACEAVGTYANGTTYLGVGGTAELLAEHRRVHALMGSLVVDPRRYHRPDSWIPILTMGTGLSPIE